MAGEAAIQTDHLLGLLGEVRRLRREQPGMKAWFDAQEACLTGLIRRVSAAGDGAAVDGAACVRAAVSEALTGLVVGTALRDELGYLVRAFRWRKRAPEATAVPMTLWEGCAAAAEEVAVSRAGAEPERASGGDADMGTGGVVPPLLAAIGETDDGGVDDRLCLTWLAELAGGRRRWRFLDAARGEGMEVRARLRVLLHLCHDPDQGSDRKEIMCPA